MNHLEIITLLIFGVIVGIVLLAIFSKKKTTLAKLENWCIAFGGLSLGVAISILVFDIQNIPVKLAISFFFIGVPAFSAGIVLKVYSIARRNKIKA